MGNQVRGSNTIVVHHTSNDENFRKDGLKCCIMTRFYSLGARFLDDRPVFGVHPKATGLTPVHFLRHFYYGGVIYAGVKRWKDALDSFLMLITAPANVLSALVVEGYKKMILVSLILSGKSPTLPKYASNVVTRQLKNHTSEYDSLATLCQAEDIKGLHAAVVEGSDTFTQSVHSIITSIDTTLEDNVLRNSLILRSLMLDCNMGLVKQVVSALTTRKIMQLTYTYITLSLKDISNTVGLEDNDNVEGQILRMVEAGDICAKIESPAGTVLFLEDMELSSSAAMTMRLGSDLQSTAELTERVRKLEARLLTNSIYVQKMSGDHSLQGSGLGGPPSYTAWEDIGMGD